MEDSYTWGRLGRYRTVYLSRVVDPAREKRRCRLKRHQTVVQGVADYHTDIDIVSHLGTHVEAPYHHGELTKDVTDLPPSHYFGRGVLLRLDSCGPRALIRAGDLETADRMRIREGDVLVLDSRYHSEPFVVSPEDERPQLGREAAEWFVRKRVKAVGFGDGVSIEGNASECEACHDIMLANDVLFIEVMQGISRLESSVFLIVFMPLPIRGLDSSPVNAIAIEGVPGFTE